MATHTQPIAAIVRLLDLTDGSSWRATGSAP